jgi:RND family efflux transporter MFP subunit
MKLLVKIILPVLVLAVCFMAARAVIANRPEPQKRPQFRSTTSIDATRVATTDYPVIVRTQGLVGAAREGSLVPEVAGTITDVSPNFVVGGAFEAGETLLQIDDRDYQIALTLAEATFAQAAATLEEEKARSAQAADDWKRLGRAGKPSALTLRQPQLAAARASLEGARAQVQRAQLDLERTRIVAPYRGRLRAKSVDVGQYVNRGSAIAQIYSIDTAEIRLPITSHQLGFVDLPSTPSSINQRKVTLHASIGGEAQEWAGKIVRTEGAIDPDSRQLFAIAQIDNPYQSGQTPLRIGQYVKADVSGKVLKDVIVIPRSALREDREVLLVDELNTLQKRTVQVLWKDAEVAVIGEGLEQGDVISLTSLGTVTNGSRVKATIDGKPAASESATAGDGGGMPPGMQERMQKLKAMVDAGQELPAEVRARVSARIADGKPVPDWLRAHIEKTAQ